MIQNNILNQKDTPPTSGREAVSPSEGSGVRSSLRLNSGAAVILPGIAKRIESRRPGLPLAVSRRFRAYGQSIRNSR